MLRFLIVASDLPGTAADLCGGLLYDFLSLFFGSDQVRIITPNDLDGDESFQTEYLFIGVPTSLNDRQLRNLKFRSAALFDYHDGEVARWGDSDQKLLRSVTDLYLRCSDAGEPNGGMRAGLLPVFRKPNLAIGVAARQFWRRGLRLPIRPQYDVSFLGSPTALTLRTEDNISTYNQRVEWLREIKNDRSRLKFWGGLVCNATVLSSLRDIEEQYGCVKDITYTGKKTTFFRYFYHACHSRVVLAPAGYSRWTFRLYEALYSGAAMVATDMRKVRMLIPLPKYNIYFVADHDPVMPTIHRAIQSHQRNPERFESNIEFLEQYLHRGRYSCDKPMIAEMFMDQLESNRSALVA